MSGSCLESLPDVREWSGGPPWRPEVVGMPYRMSGSGRLAIPDVREWSGGHSGCPRVVGRPCRRSVRLVWMSGSGRESLLDVQKARLDVRVWLRGPTGCTGVFRRPPVCSVVVGSPSRMSGCSWESFLDVREWSGGPPGCPVVVGSPSRMSGSGREVLPYVR